jgi:ABC-type antimicrobial peptide transport system permease subunit
MTANLYEYTKEIAVLRAIGLKKSRIIFLYIYEAFILVLSSSILGVLIGTFIGFSMTMQQSLFTNIPAEFFFPKN